MASVNIGARYLFPVAMAAYGIGMLKTRGWPAWLAWLGVAVGVVTLALFTFGITHRTRPQASEQQAAEG